MSLPSDISSQSGNNSGDGHRHTNLMILQQILDQQLKDNAEMKRLREENLKRTQELQETRAELDTARKQIAEDTKKMSHIMELKNTGGHEAANNPFTPTKLGDKMKSVYEEQGLQILEYFADEVEGAKFLSRTIQICYDFCKKKAYSQVKKFCFLDEIEELNIDELGEGWIRGQMRKMMNEDDCEYMYYLQWKTATSEQAIHRIKKKILDKVDFKDENYSHLYADDAKRTALESFLQTCAEACWLIATCRPALRLRFDVDNLKYESWIKKAFHVYTTQKKIHLPNTHPGLVVAVVCPALVTAADNSIILQGEVITTGFSTGKGNEAERSELVTEPMDED